MKKLTLPVWLNEPSLQQFFAATQKAGGEARVVGGAVRDHVLGLPVNDIDVASNLLPEQTMALAAQHGWKAIPTGLAHGTVTLVLPERIVEVTTLRRDVETDGRHATVAFTDSWEEDAARRDFTINAMSMDAQGKIYDYFDGKTDIAACRIRFIGDAATRIREDGLRMLRFFRFLASHGKPPADTQALAAITELKAAAEQLSGERIANELRKMLSTSNPAYALRLMKETGIAPLIFGRDIEPATMIRLHLLEANADYQTSVWARTLALLPNATAADAEWIANRWKYSRHEAQQLHLLATLAPFHTTMTRHAHTRLIRLHGAPMYLDWLLLHAARTPGIDVDACVQLANSFVPPTFPITAKDLMAKGMVEGKALGDTLAALEQRWEQSDYSLTREALLSDLDSEKS